MDPYSRRALLLDHDGPNRMLLAYAMSMGRIDYEEAETVAECVELWQPETFAFAFVDMELPKRDGLEVIAWLRENDTTLAIVVSSINDDPDFVAQAVAAGCDLVLIKPYQIELLLTLAKILNQETLRAADRVLVIDDRQRPSWVTRNSAE